MWIERVRVRNFRNYYNQEIFFRNGINVIYGENAQGKTNILEAIYLSAMGKSFRTNKDKELIKHGEDFAEINLAYCKEDRDGCVKFQLENKKHIYLNGIKIKKLSELLSNINIVIFSPDDINILKGGPENRRKFINLMIGQLKPNYIYILNLYLKTIEQRNKYLRQIRENGKSEELLDIWDEKLIEYADIIYKYRQAFINKLKDEVKIIHKGITGGKEELEIEYLTECNDKDRYRRILKERRKLDIIKGYTTKGIHRDDISLLINGKEIQKFGSQGQHRTAILSIKLAELSVIKAETNEFPVLLLDDFMSELDEKRVKNFLEKIENVQVIITCTKKIHIEKKDVFVYNVQDGIIIDENIY